MKEEVKNNDYSDLINSMRGGSMGILLGVFGIGKNKSADLGALVKDFLEKKNSDSDNTAIREELAKHENDIEYSLDQLIEIEKIIDKRYPPGHTPMNTTMIPFGFYLGELIVKTIPGAEWVTSAPYVSDIAIRFKMPGGEYSYWKPFSRVANYWKNREDKMSTFYRMCEFLSEIKFTPEYIATRVDEDGWITMANGDMFRQVVKDKSEIDLKKWPTKE